MLSDVFEGLDLKPVVVGKRLTFMGKRVVKDFSRIFRLAVHDFGGGVPNAALRSYLYGGGSETQMR